MTAYLNLRQALYLALMAETDVGGDAREYVVHLLEEKLTDRRRPTMTSGAVNGLRKLKEIVASFEPAEAPLSGGDAA